MTTAEIKSYAIMAQLKGRGKIIEMLWENIQKSWELMESLIIADPDNKTLQDLYLDTMEAHKQSKCVCSYNEAVDGKNKVLNHSMRINKNDFRISIVKKNTKVRIHIKEKVAIKLKRTYSGKESLKVYE